MNLTADVETVRAAQREAAAWPYRTLDLDELRASGWRPVPIRDLVLKIHQRCNLACDYCYVYTQADQSWRDRPAIMAEETWRAAAAAFGRHAQRHGLTEVRVILHGGEPLLFGASRLGDLAEGIRAAFPATCTVEIGLQTNGVLLDRAVLAGLVRHEIKVGVSIDGTAADHDRHRLMPNGKGSFAAVRDALDLLRHPAHRACYAGLLCTVAPETDPVACYEQLSAFEPPMIDFLLPHANWGSPPLRPAGSATPHADWLVGAFDRWYAESGRIRIRLFDDIITLLLGGACGSEQVGLYPSVVAVVESDGWIEQVDSLKSAYPGACATGLHVLRDELDAAFGDRGFVARQIGRLALAGQCLACPVQRICGGGHYVHRYRPGEGFRNPSVYCADMLKLIGHIRDRIAEEIRERGWQVPPTGAP